MNCHCCAGKLRKCGSYTNKNRRVQRFRCTRCNATSSEDQPFDGLRIDDAKVVQIVKLFGEGLGVRACARLADCHVETVLRVLEVVGQKCEAFLDRRLRNLTIAALQFDELWSYVGKKERRNTLNYDDLGDQYTFLAVDARSKLIAAHYTGKRNYDNTDAFVADLASRVTGRVQITADGWNAYPSTIRKHLLYRLDLAIMIKQYGTTIGPGVEDSARRYSPARMVGVKVEVRAGAPREDRICTSFVERCNLTVRHFNKRFARLGLGFSRKLENHKHAISLFVALYNFCKVHGTTGTTPAHGAGVTGEPWTVERLLEEATASTN